MKKQIRAFCVIAALGLLLCACSLDKTSGTDPTETVVRIGEDSANLAVFKALYDNYLPYMQYYGQDPLENQSSLESFQDWLLDSLTDDIVIRHQARISGFELSEEQEAELTQETEEEIEAAYDRLMKYAEQSFADDPSSNVQVYFDGLVNSESEYYTGIAMSWEDYKEYFREESRDAYIVEAYKELLSAEFEPSDEDIRSWYDSAYTSDKANYTDSPDKYKTDEELYETSFGKEDGAFPITYVPSGYSRIMHIVVSPEGELSEEYNAKLSRMEEIKAEYGELAFADAVSGSDENAAKLSSLLNEYLGLKAAADEEFDRFVQNARNKIYMAYGELEEGKPFSDIMVKYSEDKRVVGENGVGGCESFIDRGELISLEYDGLNDWSKTVKEEFAKLEKGEFSKVFMDGGSYHIIYYASDERAGDVPIDEIYDDIKAICLEGVQGSQWEELIDEWKNDPELEINMELVRSVGLDDLYGNED